jgi:hypothetical protein
MWDKCLSTPAVPEETDELNHMGEQVGMLPYGEKAVVKHDNIWIDALEIARHGRPSRVEKEELVSLHSPEAIEVAVVG